MNIKGKLYRLIMKVAHTYHWHYAPPIYPEGDTQLWCKWCGLTYTYPNIHLDGKRITDEIKKMSEERQ